MVLPHLKEGDSKNMERGILGGWDGLKDLKVSSLGNIYRDVWRLNRAIDAIFKEYDLVITPAMPVPPFAAKGPVPVKEFDFPLHVVGVSESIQPLWTSRLCDPVQGRSNAQQSTARRHTDYRRTLQGRPCHADGVSL